MSKTNPSEEEIHDWLEGLFEKNPPNLPVLIFHNQHQYDMFQVAMKEHVEEKYGPTIKILNPRVPSVIPDSISSVELLSKEEVKERYGFSDDELDKIQGWHESKT